MISFSIRCFLGASLGFGAVVFPLQAAPVPAQSVRGVTLQVSGVDWVSTKAHWKREVYAGESPWLLRVKYEIAGLRALPASRTARHYTSQPILRDAFGQESWGEAAWDKGEAVWTGFDPRGGKRTLELEVSDPSQPAEARGSVETNLHFGEISIPAPGEKLTPLGIVRVSSLGSKVTLVGIKNRAVAVPETNSQNGYNDDGKPGVVFHYKIEQPAQPLDLKVGGLLSLERREDKSGRWRQGRGTGSLVNARREQFWTMRFETLPTPDERVLGVRCGVEESAASWKQSSRFRRFALALQVPPLPGLATRAHMAPALQLLQQSEACGPQFLVKFSDDLALRDVVLRDANGRVLGTDKNGGGGETESFWLPGSVALERGSRAVSIGLSDLKPAWERAPKPWKLGANAAPRSVAARHFSAQIPLPAPGETRFPHLVLSDPSGARLIVRRITRHNWQHPSPQRNFDPTALELVVEYQAARLGVDARPTFAQAFDAQERVLTDPMNDSSSAVLPFNIYAYNWAKSEPYPAWNAPNGRWTLLFTAPESGHVRLDCIVREVALGAKTPVSL